MINIRFIPFAERLKGRIIIAPCFSFLATSFSSQNYFSKFFFVFHRTFFTLETNLPFKETDVNEMKIRDVRCLSHVLFRCDVG